MMCREGLNVAPERVQPNNVKCDLFCSALPYARQAARAGVAYANLRSVCGKCVKQVAIYLRRRRGCMQTCGFHNFAN